MAKKGVGRGIGGGPKTEEGKQNSRGNATKHGLCGSRNVILRDEKRRDRDAVERGWREEFQPDGYAEEKLVGELIDSDWALIRARRRVARAEEQAVEDWAEESRHHLELMHRYLTAAERSFYRAWSAVQALRKDRQRMWDKEHKLIEKIEDLTTRLEKFEKRDCDLPKKTPLGPFGPATAEQRNVGQALLHERPSKKKRNKPGTLEQWIEVRVEGGKTVTTLYPANEELIQNGRAMWPAPELVYRRLSFPDGVPEEYAWTTDDTVTRERGGIGIQRMSVETWLSAIEREKAAGTGHVGPTGVGNCPRPMSRGGCDCEVCVGNRALLAERGVVV